MNHNGIQKDLYANEFIQQKTHTNHQEKSGKPYHSPRLITRKNQHRQIIKNAFVRRKPSKDSNTPLRYLSPKTMRQYSITSFTSGDIYPQIFDNQNFQRSLFNLNLSRINAQTCLSHENSLSQTRSVFYNKNQNPGTADFSPDVDFSANESDENMQMIANCQIQLRNRRNYTLSVTQKTGFSIQTMPQNLQNKQIKELQQRLSSNLLASSLLLKENLSLQAQIQNCNLKNQQLHIKANRLTEQIESYTDLKVAFEKLQIKSYQQHQCQIQALKEQILQLRSVIQISKQNVKEKQQIISKQRQKNTYLSQIIVEKSNQSLLLNNTITETKSELLDKHEYSKHLEDAILELNQKIYHLKQQNYKKQQQIEEKDYCISQTQMILQQQQHKLKVYELEIAQNHQKIANLTLQISEKQSKICEYCYQEKKNLKNIQITQTNSKKELQHSQLLQLFQQEIQSLHLLIKSEKQMNEKLRKQVTYKQLEINLNNKKTYDFDKKNQQIQVLKNKNRTALKKLNHLIEQNAQLKLKVSESTKSDKKQVKLKRFITARYQQNNVNQGQQKPFSKTNLSGEDKLQNTFCVQLCSKSSTKSRRKSQQIDSDDEISFNLSR